MAKSSNGSKGNRKKGSGGKKAKGAMKRIAKGIAHITKGRTNGKG